ncbi:Elongation factor 4 [Labeo rohita]|uniref:Elongation factor 4 n=1 Tax=Labeo rohita TaxID=84645 RepID=A0ABQ8MUY2_LABRO|nr:Elongation factor 4 [Labeo rohita]
MAFPLELGGADRFIPEEGKWAEKKGLSRMGQGGATLQCVEWHPCVYSVQPELGVEKSCFAECKAQFKPGNFSQITGHSGQCQGITGTAKGWQEVSAGGGSGGGRTPGRWTINKVQGGDVGRSQGGDRRVQGGSDRGRNQGEDSRDLEQEEPGRTQTAAMMVAHGGADGERGHGGGRADDSRGLTSCSGAGGGGALGGDGEEEEPNRAECNPEVELEGQLTKAEPKGRGSEGARWSWWTDGLWWRQGSWKPWWSRWVAGLRRSLALGGWKWSRGILQTRRQ